MSEGVTTVGSIVGKLSVDSSDWDAELDRAEAKARQLGAANPELRVTADTASAVSKLEEVAAVEDKVGASHPTVKVDADTAGAAVKLEEVSAVEKALDAERPTIKVDADTGKAVAGLAAVDAAEKSAAASADGATKSYNGQVSAMSVVIALAPAMVAGVAPIAAAAVGLGSAFAMMGVSGVLAIKGIKDAMQVGDTVGNTYASGIVTLKGDLDNLAGTAANHMLSGFNQAVGDINTSMPFLNQTVGTFASLLGNVGGTVIHGVLSGLQQMNPLMEAGGVELSKFVGWLFSFTNTNGFSEFISYAIDNLPPVMTLIENLVTVAGHILAAFAPLGPMVLGFLNGFTSLLNALPLPILAGLVTTATSLGVALQFTGSAAIAGGITAVAEAIGLTGVMANLAVPVVGILLAAIAGIGVAAASAAAGQHQATYAVQDYTQALKEDNNAIGKHTQLMAAKALSDSGAFQAASQLGISQKLLTDAVLGTGDAAAQVKAKLDAANDAYNNGIAATKGMSYSLAESSDANKAQRSAIDSVTAALSGNSDAIAHGIQQNKDIAAATDDTNGSITAQTIALQGQAAQYGATVQGYQAAVTAQQQTADQLAQTTLNMQLENDAAGLLTNALTLLNGGSLSLAQATTGLGQANNSAASTFAKSRAEIDGNSAAALANQSAIQQVVQAADQQAEATAKATGKTQDGIQAYLDSKAALEGALKAQGQLTPAVQAYIDKLYDVNNLKVAPTTLDINKAPADGKLSDLKGQIDTLTGKPANVTITATDQATPVVAAVGAAIQASTNMPKSVRLDVNTDSIAPKLADLGRELDAETAKKHQAKIDVETSDAKAKVDMLQAQIDDLQQKKEALLKVGTADALQQASNLQSKIDDIKQQKAVALMVDPDPAIASTTSIQDHIDELKQKNQPQLKADPLPAWEMIAKTQDSIDVLHQKHDIPIMVDTAAASHAVANFQGEIDALHGKSIQITTTYVSNGVDTGIPNTTNTPWHGSAPGFSANGGPVSYLASGGSPFPGGPRGTDTVPTWLTPGEFVVTKDATARNRGALEAMNAGGTITAAATQPGPVTVNLVLDGKIIDTRIIDLSATAANNAIAAADRDARYRRAGV